MKRARSRSRELAFAALATTLGLALCLGALGLLERSGVVDTLGRSRGLGLTHHDLFERSGDRVRVSRQAGRKFSPADFPLRSSGPRVFVLGGSFVWGMPWSRAGEHDHGSLPFWLRAELRRRDPTAEVINLAGTGVPSSWVAEITADVLKLHPTTLVVASCNNEGGPAPSEVQSALRQFAGFRVMESLLQREPPPEARRPRPAVLGEIEAVRSTFRANLERVIAAARAAQVPVILATLPANLRYDDLEFVAGLPGVLSPDAEANECARQGYLAACARRYDDAERVFQGCAELPDVAAWLTLRAWKTGRDAPEAPLAARWGACVARGARETMQGRWDDALLTLEACYDNAPEALRWRGLALLGRGDVEAARAMLDDSIEVFPRVRCRPSLNLIVRELAAAHADVVTLADLDAASRAAAPDGVPGWEQFWDNNHMLWPSLATMSDVVLQAMERRGLVPAPIGPPVDRAALAAEVGLPEAGSPTPRPRPPGPALPALDGD